MTNRSEIYKHYGITGEVVKIKVKDATFERVPVQGLTIPVRIEAEYPKFLIGTVLPHYNPSGLGKSHEWPITIDKWKLFAKVIQMSS